MTRSWQFTLSSSSVWYNLWTKIKGDSSFTDPTFSTAPFVPSKVCQLFIYATTNNANVSLDSNDEIGFTIAVAGVPFQLGPFDSNIIDLETITIKPSSSSGVINVAIVAK